MRSKVRVTASASGVTGSTRAHVHRARAAIISFSQASRPVANGISQDGLQFVGLAPDELPLAAFNAKHVGDVNMSRFSGHRRVAGNRPLGHQPAEPKDVKHAAVYNVFCELFA